MTDIRFILTTLLMLAILPGCGEHTGSTSDSETLSLSEDQATEESEEEIQKPEQEEHSPLDPNETSLQFNWIADETNGASLSLDVLPGPEDETVLIRVRGQELSDIFGVAFKIAYDPTIISFISGSSSEVLTDSSSESISLVRIENSGLLKFGTVRSSKPTQNGNITYSGISLEEAIFANFTFQLVKEGEANLHFLSHGRDVRNSELDPVPVSFSGGTLSIEAKEVSP